MAIISIAMLTVSLPAQAAASTDTLHLTGLRFGEGALGPGYMHLNLLNNTASSGAVCLDGTPAGFYFAPATSKEHANDWQIYFEGGGWCYNEIDCWSRSFNELGSSFGWAATATIGGLLSSDCMLNPDFCGFNRVWLRYCDGNSFSGNRDAPVSVTGLDGGVKKLYFRGRRIIDESLKALAAHYGLGTARHVLLTGCSAGGLATYLHADYVHAQLRKLAPTMSKYKAAPISGFFLQHATVDGRPVYATEMRQIFALANSTHGLNDACVAAQPAGKEWLCNFAQHSYAYTTSDIFVLNSALDSWQIPCIYTSELTPGYPQQTVRDNGSCGSKPLHWHSCAADPEQCSPAQIGSMNKYISDFEGVMASAATYAKAGNGAFVHSCSTHCEAQSDAFFTFAIDNTTMQQAVSKWWNMDAAQPAAQHSYRSCQYKTNASEAYQCNPTC